MFTEHWRRTAMGLTQHLAPATVIATLVCAGVGHAQTIEYYHLDPLGSVRAVTAQDGQVVERHDYLPYGEEWCGTQPCAAPGGQPKHFTGKERDAETGLDYFGARYYGTRIARFTTIDPHLDPSAALADPQRWNRYSYGHNNPFRYVDPDGRDIVDRARNWWNYGIWAEGEQFRQEIEARRHWLAENFVALGRDGPLDPRLMSDEEVAANWRKAQEQRRRRSQVDLPTIGAQKPKSRKAPEFNGGEVTESGFVRAADSYLGLGYRTLENGRFVSADGLRQVRFGRHEVRGTELHGHFEAFDRPGGRIVETTTVRIVPDP
jgi:RHS repeat-associated protein